VHALLQSGESLHDSVHTPWLQLAIRQLAVALHRMSQKPPRQPMLQSLSAWQFTVQPPASHSKSHVAPSSQVKTQRSRSQLRLQSLSQLQASPAGHGAGSSSPLHDAIAVPRASKIDRATVRSVVIESSMGDVHPS
jgi:hypothetical protein